MTVLALCAACFAYVVIRWPDNFFADDSYFYFQVAWNFAHGRGSTFNGLMPTNGYHPLWMLLCSAIYLFIESKDAALHAIAIIIASLNLLTLIGTTLLLRRAGVTYPALAWLLLLPFLFTSQLGTEGALSATCLTLLLLLAFRFAQQPTQPLAFAYAVAETLTVLSRLDNIFIVAALSVALSFLPRGPRCSAARLTLLKAAVIPLAIWSLYLWSNHHNFATWQPISGVLKSHSHGDHTFGSNLPHIALLDLAILFAGLAILARLRRDFFFRTVELPVACGVLLHALYIVFFLSNETRWTWYYTTWTLLASILLARSLSALLHKHARLHWPLLASCTAALLMLAIRNARIRGHDDPMQRDPGFQANVVERGGLTTLLAFDKPGRIAYYSTARIVPLDGLMGDLRFQQKLAALGIAELIRRYHVDGFIGPPQPISESGKREFCDRIFLSATRLRCTPHEDAQFEATAAEIYARLTGTPSGVVTLSPENLVWNSPSYIAVWRIAP